MKKIIELNTTSKTLDPDEISIILHAKENISLCWNGLCEEVIIETD